MLKGRLDRLLWGAASAVVLACGGKTTLEDAAGDGGAGGDGASAGTTSGNGGATGRGGTTGRGGAIGSGGSTGRGGAAGGGGTLGNGGVGGSAGASGTGNVSKIEIACRQGRAPDCLGADCEVVITEFAIEAASYACTAEFEALLDCAIATKTVCSSGTTFPCEAEANRLTQCYEQTPTCSRSVSSNGACSVDCRDWSAECHPIPEGDTCRCTRGPRMGYEVSMLTACASSSWFSMLRSFCSASQF